MFRTGAPYGCIISFIRHYMKMTKWFIFLAIYPKHGPVVKACERAITLRRSLPIYNFLEDPTPLPPRLGCRVWVECSACCGLTVRSWDLSYWVEIWSQFGRRNLPRVGLLAGLATGHLPKMSGAHFSSATKVMRCSLSVLPSQWRTW